MTPVDILSSSERDAIVADHMRRWLTPLGLTEVTVRSWVDGSRPPVRRMFELQLLKGSGIKACWGFSLDFVPHISAGRVRWHRSNKSARLDVIIDPRNLRQASYLRGRQRLEDDLSRLMPEAVEHAGTDWKQGDTLEGMLDLVRTRRDRRSNCFGYEVYSQLPRAFVFLSAKLAHREDAEKSLKEYVKRRDLDDEEASKLLKAAFA